MSNRITSAPGFLRLPLSKAESRPALKKTAKKRRSAPEGESVRLSGKKSSNNPEIIKKIIPNSSHWSTDPVAKLTRLDEARKIYDYTGKGVGVAVIDSGFSFPGIKPAAWADVADETPAPCDYDGHGTHVTADLLKIAPGAELVLIKAGGKYGSIKNSNLVKGVQWAIENREKYNIKVLNLSSGHLPELEPHEDTKRLSSPPYVFKEFNPVEEAVEKAVEAGITVVCAAGNEGYEGNYTILTPAQSPKVIAVGSVRDEKTVSGDHCWDKGDFYSSLGPTFNGIPKPDLLAPGERIISLHSSVTNEETMLMDALSQLTPKEQVEYVKNSPELAEKLKLPKNFLKNTPERQEKAMQRCFKKYPFIFQGRRASDPGDGTSYASPHAAGLAVLLYEADPDLTPQEVREIMTSSCRKVGTYGPNTQGAGLIDIKAALDEAERRKAEKK